MVIRTKSDGEETIGPGGFLLLPAAVRRKFSINYDEPLLVASHPDRDLAIICTPAVLDEMILARFGFLP